ncbi:DciA family protein [Roseateles violae]|uniref:DciA family protein n=1 Tax=Roseateles violae TaxID=3058042 RepID=A0ABT8DY94_9BURK|nr:DciA family protein [Pelomonas sp. PFR6]MDN3922126.1 DciA family protein [Pelomonas sp. PFR6]
MPPRPAPSPGRPAVPDPLPIAQALRQHDGLARLGQLIRESNRRLEAIRPALPGALASFVKPGPVDEQGWTLLVANAAVAAKLRHLQPRLEQLLQEQGLLPALLRIKVQQQQP